MEKVKWYACKRDIGVTIFLMAFTFFWLPLITVGWHDYWLNIVLYIVLLTFIEALLICQQHFWIWIIVATLGINVSWFLSMSLENFSLDSLIVEWMMCFIVALPLVVLSRMFKPTTKIGPYLLLWPLGWFDGYWFRNLSQEIDNIVNGPMILTIVLSLVIFCLAAYLFKTDNKKKQIFLQWISVISWLPAGLAPGIMGFGWKYSLFSTILPVATIYYFFELSKRVNERTRQGQANREKIERG